MPKPFFTYEQQIALLKSKHLSIPDEMRAKNILARVGYYSLICGYKHPFKNPTTGDYRDGVVFEDIVSLYIFDAELRNLFLSYLLIVERALKSQISYSFCERYGVAQEQYLLPDNYNNTPANSSGIRILIGILNKLVAQPTDYPYIDHHQRAHRNIPLWVLINAITFGSISKMFKFLPQSLQSRVSRNYPLNTRQMEQLLSVLTKYRNACAHGERLFSYTTRDDIPDFSLHRDLGIEKKGSQYVNGKRDLFSVVVSLRFLLSPDEFKNFVSSLAKLLDSFTANCEALTKNTLINSMGFPLNWKDITSYRTS